MHAYMSAFYILFDFNYFEWIEYCMLEDSVDRFTIKYNESVVSPLARR